jgi:hypothetical protein
MNDELLPAPEVPDLPADRHRLLKDSFMQTISEIQTETQPEVRPQPARRRWVRFAAPATAFAVAAVAITAVAWNHMTDEDAVRGTAAPIVAVDPGSASGVRALVDRLAVAAAGKPSVPVGTGQFVYVKSKVAWLDFDTNDPDDGPQMAGRDPQHLEKIHDREIWLPAVRGSKGLIREYGDTIGLAGASPNSEYADLPTDPDALLRKIYADTKGQDEGPDTAAFGFIGDSLRETILPPKLLATLYRAAAKIPGVVLIQDSVDATGRHGVAVARTDGRGERTEWIFDPQTFDYLGERSYLVRATDTGPAGMLTGTTAVLQRGVVNQAGQKP